MNKPVPGSKNHFTGEYHNLKLTQKLSAGHTGYHSADDVVMTGDIASALEKHSMEKTVDQIHANQIMAPILHLVDTKKVLGEKINV